MKEYLRYIAPPNIDIMAALRGTWRKEQINKALAGRPTYQNQIDALRRKVNSQKPETQYFRVAGNHTSSGTAVEQVNHLVTSSLISSTNFRDKVTGDAWCNKLLKLKLNFDEDCEYARVLVYVPKKAGERFAPSTYSTVTHPDPSSFWVIADFYVNHLDATTNHCLSKVMSLARLKTIYDSNAAEITKGEIVISVIHKPNTAATTQYSFGYELVYNNL